MNPGELRAARVDSSLRAPGDREGVAVPLSPTTLPRVPIRAGDTRVILRTGILTALLVSVSGMLAWKLMGGPKGLLAIGLLVIFTAPGWPLGFRLFGTRHAAGLVTGMLSGYTLGSLALWSAIKLHATRGELLWLPWCLLLAVTWLTMQPWKKTPWVWLPRWRARDTSALVLVLLLVPALVGPAFLHVGATDAEGNRRYRAYFTADFAWHMALTAELERFDMPPLNPYASPSTLHYYWTYFLPPAVAARTASLRGPDLEGVLTLTAYCADLLFVGVLFLLLWCCVPRGHIAAASAAFALLAASGEGAWALWDYVILHGTPLSVLRQMNIDASAYWWYHSLTIDSLPRALWYNPQHAVAVALGLLALIVAVREGLRARAAAHLSAGVLLALAVCVSPFPGGILSCIYGLGLLLEAIVRRDRRHHLRALPRAMLSSLPVLAALVWCSANEVFEGAAEALYVGFAGPIRHAPVATLALNLGPLAIAAFAGLWPWRSLPRRFVIGATGAVFALLLFLFVSLVEVDPMYVGFRAGQILLLMLALLAGRFFFAQLHRPRIASVVAVAAVFMIGLPTTLIDAYNAQDIWNRAEAPDGPWTMLVTPSQQAAFAWIRNSTPRHAIVQMEPTCRGRTAWSLIPSFGERRMAAGLPISLIDSPRFHRLAAMVREIYKTPDAEFAWRNAHRLGINFLYIDATDHRAFTAQAISKFREHPELFTLAFHNDEVDIFRVHRRSSR